MRKTEDIYRLFWNGEEIDTLPRGGKDWKANRIEVRRLVGEYNLAYRGGVTFRNGREPIEGIQPLDLSNPKLIEAGLE